jgi:hypothetical protein
LLENVRRGRFDRPWNGHGATLRRYRQRHHRHTDQAGGYALTEATELAEGGEMVPNSKGNVAEPSRPSRRPLDLQPSWIRRQAHRRTTSKKDRAQRLALPVCHSTQRALEGKDHIESRPWLDAIR